MITTTAELAELFDSGAPLTKCNLYTFTLAGGNVVRYTDREQAMAYGGFTFQSGPILKRGEVRSAVGIDVGDLSITVSADDGVLINGVPLIQFISRGGLDNAKVLIEKAYWGEGDLAPRGTVFVHAGRVADIKGPRHEKTITVKAATEVLDVMIPRDVYQPSCKNNLFDSRCGLLKAAWGVAGAATGAGDGRGSSFPHALSQAVGWFDRGRVTFTSGPNTGLTRSVRKHTSGEVQLLQTLPYPVQEGTTFLIYPGCTRTLAVCEAKFSNRIRFRGEPWIPTPDTIT